jgi:tetratricopeptide (TPR) repeat protein
MRLRALPESKDNTKTKVGARASWGPLAPALLLFFGTLALYARTAGFEFVHYDDDLFVFENPHVNGGLSWDGIAWAFGRPDIDYWRPLTWISHMVDVELFGLKAGGHHLVSALWHSANGVLLFGFLYQVTRRKASAFVVAALFAWHPLHVESVAWVAERKDVMCAFFWLVCLIFYARYSREGRKRDYVAALISFGVGLSCKPMIITLPFQLLLLDLWPLGRWQGVADPGSKPVPASRLLLEKLPFFVLALIGGAAVVLAQDAVGALKSTGDYSLVHRVGNALLAYLGYLEKTVVPLDLACFYEHAVAIPKARLYAAVAVVGGVSVFALLSVRRLPVLFSGWFWFLGTLVPVIGLVQVGDQAMADRYSYVALIGVFWVLARGVDFLPPGAGIIRLLVALVTGAVLLGMAGLTWSQLAVWKNSETLFRHALEVDPHNRLALNNLAYLQFIRGEDGEAEGLYRRLVEVDPAADRAHYNLAEILERNGRPADAAPHWRRLVELTPDFGVAWLGLIRANVVSGHVEGAIEAAEAALLQIPDDPNLLLKISEALRAGAREDGVERLCRAVLARRPKDFGVHALLLSELRARGNGPEAIAAAERLLEIHPDAAESHYHAALVYEDSGREADGRRRFEKALELNPGFATARLALARLLAKADDPDVRDSAAALAIIDSAENALGMKLPQTLEIRAELLWREGRRAESVALMEAAVSRAREMNRVDLETGLKQRLDEMKGEAK